MLKRRPAVMDQENWTRLCVDLIARATSRLPNDVLQALQLGRRQEEEGSLAAMALDSILKNTELACSEQQPMCQDTGVPLFFIHHPRTVSSGRLNQACEEAVRQAGPHDTPPPRGT